MDNPKRFWKEERHQLVYHIGVVEAGWVSFRADQGWTATYTYPSECSHPMNETKASSMEEAKRIVEERAAPYYGMEHHFPDKFAPSPRGDSEFVAIEGSDYLL